MNHYKKLSELENELSEVRQKIEVLREKYPNLCPEEISQLCTELQVLTKNARAALAEIHNK